MSLLLPVLTILGIFVTIAWTALVFMANMMSDAPSAGFQGGWSILVPLCATLLFGFLWWHG